MKLTSINFIFVGHFREKEIERFFPQLMTTRTKVRFAIRHNARLYIRKIQARSTKLCEKC
jgi:hypothetical protein